MTMMRDVLQTSGGGIAVVQRPDNLSILARPECAAALWQRQLMPAFQTWIEGVDPDILPSLRLILQPHNLRAALTDGCDAAGMTKGPYRDYLIDDIATLTDLFSNVMAAPRVRLRLDRVSTNACRRFHIDSITARLVCTYRGTGTQYGISSGGAEPKRVFTVPTGSPILLRGTLWPEQPPAGLLHRSPPIEGSGETRLVLVLDPIFDPDGET